MSDPTDPIPAARTVLITGGTKGLGLELVRDTLAQGAKVATFSRSLTPEIEQLRADEAIAEADTLLLTVPNQLGVDYNAHVLESILRHVAPALGWR